MSKGFDMIAQAIREAAGEPRALFYSSDTQYPFTDFAFWDSGRLVLIQVTAGDSLHKKDVDVFDKLLKKLGVPADTKIDMYYVYLHHRATDIVKSGPTWDLVFTNGNGAFNDPNCALFKRIEPILKNMKVFVIRAPYTTMGKV